MDFAQLLRNAGLKVTNTRLALLNLVEQGGRHMAADAITTGLHAAGISVDRVTVYRNIDRMQQEGILIPICMPGKALSVGLCKKPNGPHHHHIFCSSCGRMEEADGCVVNDNWEAIGRHQMETNGFELTDHRLQYIGICPSCRMKRNGGD
ncbi:MAG: transcriptional repressor [Candidatus Eisenbacteria sp.]|nr:transcriptional repressor [Candidatus Eisenbacteria bacterium]